MHDCITGRVKVREGAMNNVRRFKFLMFPMIQDLSIATTTQASRDALDHRGVIQ
jgi:hypothetical protein